VTLSTPTIRNDFPGMNGKLTRVDVGRITYWFSYETCIAYSYKFENVARKNIWGTTTGKHLNYVHSDKASRVGADEFATLLAAAQADEAATR